MGQLESYTNGYKQSCSGDITNIILLILVGFLFYHKFAVSIWSVKNRSVDMKTRKPFGLRSDYVQITFKRRSITFDLRKNYVKIAQKNWVPIGPFWMLSKLFKNNKNPIMTSCPKTFHGLNLRCLP